MTTLSSRTPQRQGMNAETNGSWWLTVRPQRHVLVIVPTMTCAKRLFDVAALLHDDLRIQLKFSVPPHVFNEGTDQILAAHGVPRLPWEQAKAETFDLAITAHFGNLDDVDAPVAVFSHGASRNSIAQPRGRGSIPAPGPVIGFSRAELIRRGMVVPAALAVGHESELALLGQDCAEALPIAHVVGDPCYDRLTAESRVRDTYRDALGLEPEQKLVVVTSTWRQNSLLGSSSHVVDKLSRELLAPEYRVVLLTHPNIWAAYGSYQMHAWFGSWKARGVILARPETDWQPLLTAADYIVGDHGSVTLYGAAVGVPILLGAFPEEDVHPVGGAAALGACAPRLTGGRSMVEQLKHAADQFDLEAMAQVASLITSEPDGFARHTRRLLYQLLGLSQPTGPALLPATPLPPPLTTLDATPQLGTAA